MNNKTKTIMLTILFLASCGKENSKRNIIAPQIENIDQKQDNPVICNPQHISGNDNNCASGAITFSHRGY